MRSSVIGNLLNSFLVIFELLVKPLIETFLLCKEVDVLFALLEHILPELVLA